MSAIRQIVVYIPEDPKPVGAFVSDPIPMYEPHANCAPLVRTVGLTQRFHDLVAVDQLDLLMPAGVICGLLGPNGAGKTTTINMLTPLLPPTSGTACIAGYDIVREPTPVRRRIGYIPDSSRRMAL